MRLGRRRSVALLFGVALLIVVATIRSIGHGGHARTAATPTTTTTQAEPGVRSSTQSEAYGSGYHCVRLTVAAFTEARSTKSVRHRRKVTREAVQSCDRRTATERISNVAWYRMGASDAMSDSLGRPTRRVACLANLGCGATHTTIRYFEAIEHGAQP